MIRVLRQVGSIQLHGGTSMLRGLNNLYDIETGEVSLWFDNEVKDILIKASENDFVFLSKLHFKIAET
jgi:hypothetical protein